jgi:hypothetical protein
MNRLDWSRGKERAKVEPLLPRSAAIARQGEAHSRRTVTSVWKGPAEWKRRFFVVISVPVIAAKERRSYPINRVEDTVAIALIRRNPVIVARGVGGDRKENGVLPVWPPMGHAIAPGAKAIANWQRIETEPAIGIADERNKVVPTPMRSAGSEAAPLSAPEAADIAAGEHDPSLVQAPFGRRRRLCGPVRSQREDCYDRENTCLPGSTHCHHPETLGLHKETGNPSLRFR